MNIRYFLSDLFGREKTAFFPDGLKIQVRHGKRKLCIDLPETFQNHGYLKHPEEMAGWLQAVLEEENIPLRRCRFVLDSSQIYRQPLSLPDLTPEQRKKWVLWESGRFVPFEPGTYQAALIPREPETDAGGLAISWQDAGQSGEKAFLLVALPDAKIAALQQCSVFLKAKLKEVTAMGPEGAELPVNLLPEIPWKKKAVNWGCRGLTGLCVILSLLLALQGAARWYQAKNDLRETRILLAPLYEAGKGFREEKRLENRISSYRKAIRDISGKNIAWYPVLCLLAGNLPEGCWIEEIRGKQEAASSLEIRGCSADPAQSVKFAGKLRTSEILSGVRFVENSEKRILRREMNGYETSVTAFILQAGMISAAKEEMP